MSDKHGRPATELLVAYLEREVTASEAASIEVALADSAAARRELDALRGIREALSSPIPELEALDLVPGIRRALQRPAPARPRRVRFRGVLLSLAACLTLALAIGLWRREAPDPSQQFRAKNAAEPTAERWAGIQAYRVAPGGEPERLGDSMAASDGLLFSYTNLGPRAFSHLMIFALDARGAVRWFHPAYERSGSNPGSIPIRRGEARVPLAELIHHPFSDGPLTIYAVFSMQPLYVAEVEARLAARPDPTAPLGLRDTSEQRLETRVGP